MNLTKKMKTRCITMDQNKLNRVLESMKETGIEQLLISDPASINYLTGRYVNCMERMQVLYNYCSRLPGKMQAFFQKILRFFGKLPRCTQMLFFVTTPCVKM